MKFLKSLLAVILVVAMLVPSITVFAANNSITLEQVKKYYPNMGYVDTYYYGGKEAYGDSTKAYKCYYLENKNTDVSICFFKNNVLETNKSIVEKLAISSNINLCIFIRWAFVKLPLMGFFKSSICLIKVISSSAVFKILLSVMFSLFFNTLLFG